MIVISLIICDTVNAGTIVIMDWEKAADFIISHNMWMVHSRQKFILEALTGNLQGAEVPEQIYHL